MSCKNCNSKRIASITAKCSDCCSTNITNAEKNGYVPRDMGIGGGDYVEFSYCLNCGKIQGEFPLEETALEIEGEEISELKSEDEE